MLLNRRQFMQIMAVASAAGLLPQKIFARQASDLYDVPNFGQVRLLHITDTHAQLLPLYYREPHINLGFDSMQGQVPHLVGKALLKQAGIAENTPEAHAFTYLNFSDAAQQYGKVGGFAHLASLVKQLRDGYGREKTLLLDGGDTWQGSGTAYWTRGQDMVGACNLLGVDVMTGHWEFTYLAEEVLKNLQAFKGEFVAQNITVREEAYLFEGKPVYDEQTGHAFKPYTIKTLNGIRVAIVGQAFPYTPIANPARFIPDWTFGIQDKAMQSLVNEIRAKEKPELVVVISHNGMDVDLKMATQVTGIDVILGGHTHDGVPKPVEVKNTQGTTLVCNAGSNGKFLGVLDFAISDGKVKGYQYRLLPVFANLLPADKDMQAYIDQARAPYLDKLTEKLATTDTLLYRRGNFNGTFDQLICNALRQQHDAQIALSPGFRWGTSILSGQAITMENVLDQTCITYPETYRREMTGSEIKLILEDVCDNLFNPDPYRQQGGDMVRVGGLNYVCDPTAGMNQRISNLTLDDGTALDMEKRYPVAGWATVGSQAEGKPIWDIVAEYLRAEKVVKIEKVNMPKLQHVENNLGFDE
ncbi:5'-nucleotidase/2',3'-cyclic phosphodiesterase-like hydrolase [Beggiatoa alba B18LD]|uniref:5'-nucleotidase/2',3'-cyclic phosphodiesterase-like hydrolase n=1 Tax=Beggiatoa alba B18LD TaxID=395493 RepID=I3CK34_9GAMM|nr:thiosulfohydrolase SoxB [Beggiatoa alba]EIJ43977.1 5'-nucleotidase/2',3'-cyclic phosphodiesterase-like hydrolase [Beggiatoa alba B18LD]